MKAPTQKQTNICWFALTALAIASIVVVLVGVIWGLGKILNLLSPVLWPLAIAAVFAYLFDPLVDWLERKKIPRVWGILIVFVVSLSLLGGVLASVIPQLVDESSRLVSKIPTLTAQAQNRVENWADNLQSTNAAPAINTNSPSAKTGTTTNSPTAQAGTTTNELSQTNSLAGAGSGTNSLTSGEKKSQIKNKIISSGTAWLENILPKVGGWLLAQLAKVSSLIDVAVALILIPVSTFYFLREKRGISANWTRYLPLRESHVKDELIFILTAINQYMIAFFRGQVLVALCSGVLYTISFLILGLDYALLLGFMALLLTMVPFLGAIINCALALILTAVQFGDWFHPLMVLIIFVIVQSLESFVYSPKIMGDRVGLHPLVIIIALMVGATLLGGILGGVLAIPLAAALRVLMFRYVWKKHRA